MRDGIPAAMTGRSLLRRLRAADDSGQSVIIVLVIAALLAVTVATVVATSTANLSFSSGYKRNSQATLASYSGLNAVIASMRNASSYTALPCGTQTGSLTASGATSSFTVDVAYSTGGTPITSCPVATPPTAAVLTSTGTASHGTSVVTKADVLVQTNTSNLAFQYAIFTQNSLNLSNGAVVCKTGSSSCSGGSGPSPDIYDGGTSGKVTCPNGVITEGDLITYQSFISSGACSIGGSLETSGYISLGNGSGCSSPTIGGNATAFGVDTSTGDSSYGDGIYMSGNVCLKGNAVAADGNIATAGSASIGGTADSSGTISSSTSIDGHSPPTCPSSYCTENDGSISSNYSMPAPIAWPTIDPSIPTWQADETARHPSGYTVVQIPNSTYTTCSSYFQNLSSGANDPFMTQIENTASPLVIYAPQCEVTYSRAHTFKLNNDVVLEVQSLQLNNSNTFESTTSTVEYISILATPNTSCSYSGSLSSSPCTTPDGNTCNTETGSDSSGECTSPTPCSPSTTPPTGGISAGNLTTFTSTVNAFIYTPAQVSWGNAPTMTGQIFACGGLTGANAFQMDYSPNAAQSLGAVTPPGISVTVEDKYLLN